MTQPEEVRYIIVFLGLVQSLPDIDAHDSVHKYFLLHKFCIMCVQPLKVHRLAKKNFTFFEILFYFVLNR